MPEAIYVRNARNKKTDEIIMQFMQAITIIIHGVIIENRLKTHK